MDEEDEIGENIIYIDSVSKHVNTAEEIEVITGKDEVTFTTESIAIIKELVDKLYEEIDFLKEELREKNIDNKTLNFRNTNDGELICIDFVNSKTDELNVETTPELSTNSITIDKCNSNHNNSRDGDYNECDKIVEYDDGQKVH